MMHDKELSAAFFSVIKCANSEGWGENNPQNSHMSLGTELLCITFCTIIYFQTHRALKKKGRKSQTNVRRNTADSGCPEWQNVDNKNTDLLSKHTIKQAYLASHHSETNAVLPFGSSFGSMSIPKISIDHQGFAGTITHMDGMTQRRRQRKIEFMYSTTGTTNQHTWSINSEQCDMK